MMGIMSELNEASFYQAGAGRHCPPAEPTRVSYEVPEALVRPLETVREEIARDLLRREALRERARGRAQQLADAVRGGKSLEDAAREAMGKVILHP